MKGYQHSARTTWQVRQLIAAKANLNMQNEVLPMARCGEKTLSGSVFAGVLGTECLNMASAETAVFGNITRLCQDAEKVVSLPGRL